MAAVRDFGIGGHLLAGIPRDAGIGAHGVQDAPRHILIGTGLDPFISPLCRRPRLDPIAPRRGLRIGENEARDRNGLHAAVRSMEFGRAGVVHAHPSGITGRLGTRTGRSPLLPVPGITSVIGVSIGQSDGHLILIDVIGGIGQAAVPGLAAVTPLPGTTDVIEIVEGITRPGAGNSGHQRALGLLVGQIGRVTEVLEVGQGAGGHELAGVAQVPLVDEILSLPVVEYGNIRLRLTLELGLVVTPLEPLNGIDIAARASGRENRGRAPPAPGAAEAEVGTTLGPSARAAPALHTAMRLTTRRYSLAERERITRKLQCNLRARACSTIDLLRGTRKSYSRS